MKQHPMRLLWPVFFCAVTVNLNAEDLVLYPSDAEEGQPGVIHMHVEVVASQPVIDFPSEPLLLSSQQACKRALATFNQFFPEEPPPFLEDMLLVRIPPDGELARWFWIVTLLPADNRPTDYLGNVMESDVLPVAVGMDGTAFLPALRVGVKPAAFLEP